MLGALETRHVGTDLGNHLERGRRVDAVDARQVDAAHAEEIGADIELRRIACSRATLGLARFAGVILL